MLALKERTTVILTCLRRLDGAQRYERISICVSVEDYPNKPCRLVKQPRDW